MFWKLARTPVAICVLLGVATKVVAESTVEPESNVVDLTQDTFDESVSAKPSFVMFYAPWCGHCKRLHPTWDKLSNEIANIENGPQIAKVDCTKHTKLCASHEVNGYPTLRLFQKGLEDSEKYKGSRELEALQKYVLKKMDISSPDEKEEGKITKVFEHTQETFDEHVKTGSHFIKFYAPWCGHCQRLAPTWDMLSVAFEDDPLVTVSKLDCTLHKSKCQEFEVKGYPTLLWIVDGKKAAKYSGDRSLGDLKKFVKDNKASEKVTSGTPQTTTESFVVPLTSENFANALLKGVVLVKYYAPWCGHCKRLAPTYEALGEKFVNMDQVTIAKVDCTQAVNEEVCSTEEINGFPTLFLYKDGTKLSEYKGDRSLEDFVTFISSHVVHEEL